MQLNVKMVGNIGNRMLQYMTAAALRHAGLISGINGLTLPEWGVSYEKTSVPSEFEFPGKFTLAQFMERSKGLETVGYSSIGLRFESFQDVDCYKRLFDGSHIEADGYSADHIVFNVRLGDTANGLHPDYTLIPISFYRHLVERTRLRPVFLGQISDDLYSQTLLNEFPDAEFARSRGAMVDFETLRRSAVICCAVSTFSFLAAWLSDAQKIFFPLTGANNPMQRRDNDMIPTKDPRYEFYAFPINYSGPMDAVVPTLERRAGAWCYISRNMATKLLKHESHFSVPIETAIKFFDEEFYLRKYPDITRHVNAGRLRNGLQHFMASGHFEHRQPFELDVRWYANTYPDAAMAVGVGRLGSLHDYHMEVGHTLGHYPIGRDIIHA